MKHKKFTQVYPYTYLITRKSDNKKYHGVRYANVKRNTCPIDDLGVTYFTSSKYVQKDFKNNPDNYIFKVVWTFDSVSEAIEHEYKVNSKIFYKEDWLNLTYGKNFGEHPNIGELISLSKTPEVMLKTKKSLKSFLNSEEGLHYRDELSKRKGVFWEDKTYEERLAILENAHNSEKQKESLKQLQECRKKIVDESSGDTWNKVISRKSANTRKQKGLDSLIGKKRNEAYNLKLANMTNEEFESWCEGKSKVAISGAITRRNKQINLQ